MNRIFSFKQLPARSRGIEPAKGLISRRTVLRGAGGVALALPFLEIMSKSGVLHAGEGPGYTSQGHAKRFIVWFTPNGTIANNWVPKTSGRDFEFSRILKPLEPFREKLIVIDGLDQTGTGGDGHQSGMQGMLTGQNLNPGPFKGGGQGTSGWANGISVDQHIANHIGLETKFKSLELSVQSGNDENNWNRMSLLGPDRPVPPEQSPYRAYQRLFKDFNPTPNAPGDERETIVLNRVMENYRALNKKLGADDKKRLDQHLQAISEIEMRLGKTGNALASCQTPMLGGEIDVGRNENFPLVGKLQMDLLVAALSCDLTRVGSLMWNKSFGLTRHSWVEGNGSRAHHDWSHDGDSDTNAQEVLTKINIWFAQQLAYLLGALDAIPEGDGTMLDNTVLLWCNELSKGNNHSRNDNKYVVAGGADYFSMGQCLKFNYGDNLKHNDLLRSLVNSMDIEDTTFGRAEWNRGPVAGMTG